MKGRTMKKLVQENTGWYTLEGDLLVEHLKTSTSEWLGRFVAEGYPQSEVKELWERVKSDIDDMCFPSGDEDDSVDEP